MSDSEHSVKRGYFHRAASFGTEGPEGLRHHAEFHWVFGCHADCPDLWYERGRYDGRKQAQARAVQRVEGLVAGWFR